MLSSSRTPTPPPRIFQSLVLVCVCVCGGGGGMDIFWNCTDTETCIVSDEDCPTKLKSVRDTPIGIMGNDG